MAKFKLKKPNLKLKLKKPRKINTQSTGFIATVFVVLALVGFGVSGYYWYNNIFTDKEQIFYDMIDKSLNTSSVLRTVEQNGGGKTEKQSVLVGYSPDIIAHTASKLEQISQSRQRSSVATETYGSRDADYVRYTGIVIPTTERDNTDYSKVLNTWAKRSNTDNFGAKQSQFLDEVTFTFIPFGNFPNDKRAELIQKLKDKKVYQLHDTKITYENGRPVYTGLASINPRGFVEVMRDFANSTGIGDSTQLDPEQYENKNSFTIQLKIDVISRHLTAIKYPNGDRDEKYVSYGLNKKLEVPTNYISIDELQGRLQQN